MSDPKRRYIDELLDGIRFSGGGPVSISLETARILLSLYKQCRQGTGQFWPDRCVEMLEREMPEPKP